MSVFGDRTAKQAMLEGAELVQIDHDLTNIQLLGVILAVLRHFQEFTEENEVAEKKFWKDHAIERR